MNRTILLVIFAIASYGTSCLAQIRALSIGDKCPPELISYIQKNTAVGKASPGLQSPTIIDFWATYCAPCIKKLPLLDSLQKESLGQIDIICVTQQKDQALITEVLGRSLKESKLHFVMADTIAKQYFPHSTLPHYVWIDKNGIVSAVTASVDRESVLLFSRGMKSSVPIKPKKIAYRSGYPLYSGKQVVQDDEMAYQSMIARFRADLPTVDARGENYITVANNSILHLYQIAFGKFDLDFLDLNRVELQGFSTRADSINIGVWTGDKFSIWKREIAQNAYTYEISFSNMTSKENLFVYMQQDLNRYFSGMGLVGSLELREKKVLRLVGLNDKDYLSFKPKGLHYKSYTTKNTLNLENVPMAIFLAKLRSLMGYIDLSIVNSTDYIGPISIVLNGALNDLESLNKSLSPYGLRLEEAEQRLPVVIIKKNAGL